MWTLGIASNWFDTFCMPPELERPLVDGLVVVDAEVVLERHDLARVVERVRRGVGAAAVQVSDRGIHGVEDQNREQLYPTIEDVSVGEHACAGEPRPTLHV